MSDNNIQAHHEFNAAWALKTDRCHACGVQRIDHGHDGRLPQRHWFVPPRAVPDSRRDIA